MILIFGILVVQPHIRRILNIGQVLKKNVWLDLGTVHALADVTLNGQPFRTLWRPPYRVNISEVLKEGYNTIEVVVTNCWLNRLIGDLQFGARKYTWAPYVDWNAETPLLPSGLIGPVTLLNGGMTLNRSTVPYSCWPKMPNCSISLTINRNRI